MCLCAAACRYVCDIARAMFVAPSFAATARLLDFLITLAEREVIVVRRIKHRWEEASEGGWRDIMINFHLASDPRKHVCELQLVHEVSARAAHSPVLRVD